MPPRLTLSVLLLALAFPVSAQDAERPQNLVIMIADGFGPATAALGREVGGAPLALDSLLRGAVRTASASHRIADSASGAVPYASGIKTYNGAIGVDTLGRPVGTILEAAEARGMATGIISTGRVSDATPAAFTAHVPYRSAENEIAAQQLAQGMEVILGGGRRHFLPQAEGRREDGRDLLAEAEAMGYTVVATPRALAEAEAPVLGLFAPDVMTKEIDRDASQPSLAAMTQRALDLLRQDEDGFLLMVETEGTDEAGHDNDPAALAREVLAYDEALQIVLNVARSDGHTLVVSLSDHETGGLTLGRGRGYVWDPAYLRRVTASAERMHRLINEGQPLESVLRAYAAIDSLTADEREVLTAASSEGRLSRKALAHLMSRRAWVGWTTGSHTAVDVGLYAWGPGAERLHGTMDSDAVGRVLADLLGLDLAEATERARAEYPEGASPGQ